MFWAKGRCLAYSLTNLPRLLINFLSLFHCTWSTTWTISSLNCMYPLIHVHISHRPYGYPFLTLCSWQWEHKNPWCNLWHLCCHCVRCWLPCGARIITCVFFKHIQIFLSMNQHCVHQKWHSHLSRCYHCRPNTSEFTSSILRHPRVWCFQCGSSQRMELSQPTPCQSIPPFICGAIWMFI